MKRCSLLCIYIVVAVFSSCAYDLSPKLRHVLDSLDLTLEHRSDFVVARQAAIDSIKLAGSAEEIAKAYIGFQADSALHYCSDSLSAVDCALVLAEAGMAFDAIALLDSVPGNHSVHYWAVRSEAFIKAARQTSLKDVRARLNGKAAQSLDSLLVLMPEYSAERLFVESEICRLNGDETMALGMLNEAKNLVPTDALLYSALVERFAQHYEGRADKKDEYLYYLTLSAIDDVRNAECNAVSLARLGVEMLDLGNREHAYTYITAAEEAMERALPNIYMAETLPALSSISKGLREDVRSRNLYMAILCVLMFVVAGGAVFVVARNRKLTVEHEAVQNSLKGSINTRDIYINQLINLCAVYMEGIEDFNRLAGRKLKAGQSQDLLNMIEAGKIIHDQNERFFEVFDHAVLKIFPNFIEELNTILLPEKQIALASSDRLTPELRILAFMRLGVSDSTRISKFLGLSLNTVYTYRNRMKNRAVNRDNFDLEIQNIGKKA